MLRSLMIAGAAALSLLIPRWAAAQAEEPPEVESRFDLNTFRPASSPGDGFVLEHGEVLRSLQFGFEAIAQVDDDPLTWQRKKEDGSYEETAVAVERLIALHLGGVVGFFDYAQLAVQFPAYFDKGDASESGGIGDLRLVPKGAVRFTAGKAEIGMAALVPLSVPTGEEESLIGEGGVSVAPGIAFDLLLAKLRLIINAAYYWREEVEKDLVRGAELMLGLGIEYDIPTNPGSLRILVEAATATQISDIFGRLSTPTDLLGGLKYRFSNGIGLLGAAGTGVTQGVGSPDVRVVLGADYIWQKPEQAPESIARGKERAKDSDGDGIPDSDDYCPEEAEDFDRFEDEDGCAELDNDGDGIPDGKDRCPNANETVNGWRDDDGCPEVDSDGDKVYDEEDTCPEALEDHDGFEDGDGCPEEDNDLDGFLDQDDRCPVLPSVTPGGKKDDGCPLYFDVVDNKLQFKRPIRFERSTANLTGPSYDVLDEVIAAIIANPQWEEIYITVHTQGRGNSSANQRLSEDQAMTILRFLVGGGVVPERLIATGKGDSEPIASPDTNEGRRKNRRVEIEFKKGVEQ